MKVMRDELVNTKTKFMKNSDNEELAQLKDPVVGKGSWLAKFVVERTIVSRIEVTCLDV